MEDISKRFFVTYQNANLSSLSFSVHDVLVENFPTQVMTLVIPFRFETVDVLVSPKKLFNCSFER